MSQFQPRHGMSDTRIHYCWMAMRSRCERPTGAIGGGADGFNKGEARIGNMVAKYRCIGSVDVDAAANRDFERRIGVKATTLDLFDRSQYIAFNDKEPPADWREAIYLRTMFDSAFEPMWPLVITDELATPIIRTHGDGGRT